VSVTEKFSIYSNLYSTPDTTKILNKPDFIDYISNEDADYLLFIIEDILTNQKNNDNLNIFKDVLAGQENYNYDFSAVMIKNDKQYLFEVERKKVWKDKGFFNPSYSDIQIPARKSKCKADCFIMFNFYYDTALMGSMNFIKSCPIREVNTYNFKNDQFFAVPLNQFVLFEKTIDGWEKVSYEEHEIRRMPKNVLFQIG
jgi:hypothetical protein